MRKRCFFDLCVGFAYEFVLIGFYKIMSEYTLMLSGQLSKRTLSKVVKSGLWHTGGTFASLLASATSKFCAYRKVEVCTLC